MSVDGIGTCEVCGSKSWFYSDYKELLNENHCLSVDCGFFKVESEIETNWSGSDYRTPEEVREFIEEHELEDELDDEYEEPSDDVIHVTEEETRRRRCVRQ